VTVHVHSKTRLQTSLQTHPSRCGGSDTPPGSRNPRGCRDASGASRVRIRHPFHLQDRLQPRGRAGGLQGSAISHDPYALTDRVTVSLLATQLPCSFRAASGQLPGSFRAASGQLPGSFRAGHPRPRPQPPPRTSARATSCAASHEPGRIKAPVGGVIRTAGLLEDIGRDHAAKLGLCWRATANLDHPGTAVRPIFFLL
jgi:hypothetical protein